MRHSKLICLGLLSFGLAVSQPNQPDCLIAFNLTSSGATQPPSSGADNRQLGCNSWQISYASNGFSAITLAVQSAPDNVGVPGSWGTIGGTVTQGVNPNTNTTGASTLLQTYGTAFAPWFRVALTSATGSGNVIGVLIGYRAAGTAGAAGTITGTVTANQGSPPWTASITSPLGQQGSSASVSVAIANNQATGTSSIPTQGAAAAGSTLAGNPNRMGVSDGTNIRDLTTVNAGNNLAPATSGIGTVSPYQFQEATQVNPANGTAGNFAPLTGDLNGNQFVRVGGPNSWTCSLGQLNGTLTQCLAAPGAGLRAYITDITAATTTSMSGTFIVQYGTGVNCASGTTTIFPILPVGTGVQFGWFTPAQTTPVKFTFTQPLTPAAANAICVSGTTTNTQNIQLGGFIAP